MTNLNAKKDRTINRIFEVKKKIYMSSMESISQLEIRTDQILRNWA